MPYFVIEGTNKATGRRLKPREYLAKDANAAAAKARKDGIAADTVALVEVTDFVLSVAGVSHPNRDGTSRQEIIGKCRPLERLVLEHEEGNRYDVHAIRILRTTGQQVGYVPQGDAERIINGFRKGQGCCYSAIVMGSERLGEDTKLRTLELLVFVALPTTDPNKTAGYVCQTIQQSGRKIQPEQLLPLTPLEARPFVPTTVRRMRLTCPAAEKPSKNRAGCLPCAGLLCVGALGLFCVGALAAVRFFG